MVTAGKIAAGSSLAAVPAVVAAGAVYKDELFGPSVEFKKTQEENTYWKFFYFLLKNYIEEQNVSLDSSLADWGKLKERCRSWKNSEDKSFVDILSENCAVIMAFRINSNGDWGKYLGYFNKFKSEGWGTKEIDYSGSNVNNENSYKKLYSSFKISSTKVTEQSMAKEKDWNPSSIFNN